MIITATCSVTRFWGIDHTLFKGGKNMAHIEIVTIEYNGLKEPGFTGVTYERFDDIDGCLDYFIEISPDSSSKERKIRHFKEKGPPETGSPFDFHTFRREISR